MSSRSPDTDLLGSHARTVTTTAVGLILIGFSQTAGDSNITTQHRYRVDINQESVTQGMANVDPPRRGCQYRRACRPAR